MEQSNWDKHNLPCPKCGGSDPVSTNKMALVIVLVVENIGKIINQLWMEI